MTQWPFEEDPTLSIVEKLSRVDEDGKSWNVLYEFNLASEKYQGARSFGHRMRYEEFRFFYCVFVKKGKTRELAESLEDKKSFDVDNFKPRQFTDGPYLREAHRVNNRVVWFSFE